MMDVTTGVARVGIAAMVQWLGVDRATIYRWYTTGTLPRPHYLGDRRMWLADEIAAWVAQQMARPASARAGSRRRVARRTPGGVP